MLSNEQELLGIENWFEVQENVGTPGVSFRDWSRFLVQYIFVPIVVIIGVMGNAVTIYILTRRPMHSSTNVYLTALAVSDLLYLLFSFSMSWRHFPHVETFWPYWWYTPFGLWITDASSSTSVWLIVFITVERYIAVCHPTKREICGRESRAIFTAILVYVACFALTSTTPFEWKPTAVVIEPNQTVAFNETIYVMERTEFGNNETYRLVYHWFTTIFFVVLPMVILGIFNFFLIQAVRKCQAVRRNSSTEATLSVRSLQKIRQENRITVLLIGVVILFLICQMPTAIVLIYTSWIPIPERGSTKENILLGIGNIFNLLVAINAASNFVLYVALSDKYRKYFCKFFTVCRRNSTSDLERINGRFKAPMRLHLLNDILYNASGRA